MPVPVLSINSLTDDVVDMDFGPGSSDRDEQAKVAGHMIYQSVHNIDADLNAGIPPPVSAQVISQPATMAENSRIPDNLSEDPIKGRMSSVRRTFCLFVLFDLILMFILWVIYTQLIGEEGYKAFGQQVEHYTFKTSLFDCVMLSAVRFTFLLLAYALMRISHWWTIALTTALSCAFLIAKIFRFDFSGSKTSNNPLSFMLIIISFVLAWVETWFLDFKVLPHEKKLMARLQLSLRRGYGTAVTDISYRPLISDDMRSTITEENQFYSPLDSPQDSDTETPDGLQRHKGGATSSSHGGDSRQDNDYMRLARHSFDVLWTYLKSPESEWKVESGTDADRGIVHSKRVKGVGKVFRLTATVNMPHKDLFEEINFKAEEQPVWNGAIKESKILQVVDDHTDILYNVSTEIAGGVISSRDFVSLRHWELREGIYVGAGMAVNHPDKPPQKAYVRGTNGVGGFVYKPVSGDHTCCLFQWFMNTDIKGWFPQKLIDSNMAKVQLDFVKDLRKHLGEKAQS